jgi:hypothetical protein
MGRRRRVIQGRRWRRAPACIRGAGACATSRGLIENGRGRCSPAKSPVAISSRGTRDGDGAMRCQVNSPSLIVRALQVHRFLGEVQGADGNLQNHGASMSVCDYTLDHFMFLVRFSGRHAIILLPIIN